MTSESKIMALSYLMITMLLPLAGDLIRPRILAAVIVAGGLVVGFAVGRRKRMFVPMRFHQEFWMLAAAVFLFGMVPLCERGILGESGDGSIFAYLGLSAMFYYVMRGQDAIRMAQFDFVFYAGSAILLLYLVSYAISADMVLLPLCVLSDKTMTDAVGIINAMIAAWGFCREKDRVRRMMYCAGGVIAFLVVALNDTPGMMLLLLAGIYALVLTVPPVKEYIKRALSLFIGATFLACNLSLILDYTKVFKLDGLSYSLQGSAIAELLLSGFTLYAVSVWDRLKENGELNKKGLSILQKKLERLAVCAGKVFLVFLIFCGIHLWVGLDRFMVLFFEERWAEMQEGMVVSVLVKWVERMSSALSGLWKGSLPALCYRAGGAAGLLLGTFVVIWALWQIRSVWRAGKNMRLLLIISGEISALLFMAPVCVELLPFYAVWIDLLICGLQPKAEKKPERLEAETG